MSKASQRIKANREKTRDNSRRPKYVVYLGNPYNGYYHSEHSWSSVPKDQAEQLFHKEANNIRNYFHRTIGLKGATVEPVTPAT